MMETHRWCPFGNGFPAKDIVKKINGLMVGKGQANKYEGY